MEKKETTHESFSGSIVVIALFAFQAFAPFTAVGQQTPRSKEEQTLSGVISDAACGATHTMKNMSAADCARMCVKAGQKYVLVSGKDVYTLQGHEADLDKVAGEKVTVKGTVNGKTVTVQSVSPSK
jgi:hypothetical protein